jgi:hypothetical protein
VTSFGPSDCLQMWGNCAESSVWACPNMDSLTGTTKKCMIYLMWGRTPHWISGCDASCWRMFPSGLNLFLCQPRPCVLLMTWNGSIQEFRLLWHRFLLGIPAVQRSMVPPSVVSMWVGARCKEGSHPGLC